MPDVPRSQSFAIADAGLSGLACARTLAVAGVPVGVIEASDALSITSPAGSLADRVHVLQLRRRALSMSLDEIGERRAPRAAPRRRGHPRGPARVSPPRRRAMS